MNKSRMTFQATLSSSSVEVARYVAPRQRQIALFSKALLVLTLTLVSLPTWGETVANESAEETKKDEGTLEFRGVEIQDKLGAELPLELNFMNEAGEAVRLEDYFNQDKPVLLTMVYYNCPMLCSLVLNGAIEALKELGWTPGVEFESISVSISPVETPELARAKKKNYLKQLGVVGAEKGWHFLTGDQPQIKALAETIGFGYRYDPSTQDYAHGAALFFFSPKGKLTRLLKGIQFDPNDLRMSLVEASEGKIGSIYDQLLLRCFRYEPSSKKYAFYIWGAVRLGGLFTIFGIGLLLLVLWRGERRGDASLKREFNAPSST